MHGPRHIAGRPLKYYFKSEKLEEIQGVTLTSGDFVAQIRRVSKEFVDKNRLDLDTQRTEALKQKEALRQRRRSVLLLTLRNRVSMIFSNFYLYICKRFDN